MRDIDQQMRLEDWSDDYAEFMERIKTKKTTDDCYTPENIYEAVLDWAANEYEFDKGRAVRPFWPGADYERYEYKETDVVVDNPPFSIVSKIVNYYNMREIPFFLFAPYLTNLGIKGCQHIITETSITYENGAEVPTAFVTNMDEFLLRAVPELTNRINEENKKNLEMIKKTIPKYSYPDEVITAAQLGYISKYGIALNIPENHCFFIRSLESQREKGKGIFGAGFLLSKQAAAEKAAAEKAAVEKAAVEKAAVEKWTLSDAEKAIIDSLGKEVES